jgi:hypothetical protein
MEVAQWLPRNMTDFFSKPTTVAQPKDGSGNVRLTWPDGHAEHVGDFHLSPNVTTDYKSRQVEG